MTKPEHDIEGLKSGKKIFLLTLFVCVVVPLVGVVVALWLSNDLKGVSEEGASDFPPLVWEQHENWQTMKVNPTEIVKKPGHKPPFEGRVRRKLPFALSEQQRREIGVLSSAAERWEQAVDAGLDELADFSGEAFYGDYLRGRYKNQSLRASETAIGWQTKSWNNAFEKAEKALVIRYLDESGEPLISQNIGTVRVICAIKQDGVVDEGVVLVFPYEITDKNGYIYLPVYDTVLRLEGKLPNQEGEAGNLKGMVEYDIGGGVWFEIPGQVGELNAVVKRRN
ncbi:hypothetical protein JD969_20325 [Planctomycetota bacterium]|nr:hypothetical protein JD969_20325 [Planctomycetota bacterium]